MVACENDGCSATIPLSTRHLHHSRCPYSPYLPCIVCPAYEPDLASHLVSAHGYKDIRMETGGGLRVFAGTYEMWRSDSEWPPAVWRMRGEAVVVSAVTRNGVFHIYMYRVSKGGIRVSVAVQHDEKEIKFTGSLQHTSETEPGAHFHSEVTTLEQFFVRASDSLEEVVKLRVRVKRKKLLGSGL